MHFSIITIFPEIVETYLNTSILGRAQEDNIVSVAVIDPREFTDDKHSRVDEPSYGGGPGMVMKAEPILRAVKSAKSKTENGKRERVIVLSPGGDQFDQEKAQNFATVCDHIIFIAGRYEGIDHRVIEALSENSDIQEISVGPYVLTGGELPCLTIIDAVTRLIPGTLGNENSLENTRPAGSYVYTRPEVIEYEGKKYEVPDVLLSGHHAEIEKWRQSKTENSNSQNSSVEE